MLQNGCKYYGKYCKWTGVIYEYKAFWLDQCIRDFEDHEKEQINIDKSTWTAVPLDRQQKLASARTIRIENVVECTPMAF